MHGPRLAIFLPRFVLAGIVIVGVLLRTQRLNAQSLWLDEGFTVLFARQSWSAVLGLHGQYDAHPPLYYALVKFVTLFLPEVAAPRLLSVGAGTLTIIVVYALGSRLANRWAGIGAATVLAVSPLHIYYSQEGRQYAVTALIVALSYLALAHFFCNARPGVAGLYGLAVLVAIYLDYSAIYPLAPQIAVIALAIYRYRRRALSLVLALLAAIIGFLPWMTQLFETVKVVGNDRGGYLGVSTEKVALSILSITGLGGNGSYFLSDTATSWDRWPVAHVLLTVGSVILVVISALLLARSHPALLLIGGCLFVGTIVTAVLISLRSPGYADRTVLYATLGWSMLIGAAPFVGVRPRWLTGSALIGTLSLLLLSTISINAVHHDYFKQQWRELAAAGTLAPADAPLLVFPGNVVATLLDIYQPGLLNGRQIVLAASSNVKVPLAADGQLAPSLWFAYGDYAGSEQIREQLAALGYERVLHKYYFNPLYLDLYAQPKITLGETVPIDNRFEPATAQIDGWRIPPEAQFYSDIDNGRELMFSHAEMSKSRAVLEVSALPRTIYTVHFEARSRLTAGETKAWLICLSQAGTWSEVAPHGGGEVVPNDSAWHTVRIAAICPTDTVSVLIDLRNEGIGESTFRRVGLQELVGPQPTEASTPTGLARRSFHEIKGGGEWPDYAQLGPGEERKMSLGQPANAPRLIHLVYFDLAGRDLDIYADDKLVGQIKAGASGGKWVPIDFALPSGLGTRFTLTLRNPGNDISAFSEVEVRYASEAR